MKLCTAIFSSALLIAAAAWGQATKEKPKAPSAMEQTQTTTKTTDTGTVKTKSQTATGTVKEYTEGKSIVVTTAKGKDRTFDLSGNNLTASVASGVAVGNEVKIVEKTDNSGHKTVSVNPFKGKGHRARAKTSA